MTPREETPAEVFVIITIQKSLPGMTKATTMSWNLTPGPAVTREDLFRYVVDNLIPEEYRGSVVLFYSAEPLRFAHSGQPVPPVPVAAAPAAGSGS
jgi:hypothetical protein